MEPKVLSMHNTNEVRMLEFAEHGDDKGKLVIAEGMQDIPFAINRVFYIYGTKTDVVRGQHANKKSEFVLINVAGTSKVRIIDAAGNEAVYSLNRPRVGLYLPTMVWKDMYDFSEDSVLLVLCSEHYDPTEYIRDYDEFKRLTAELYNNVSDKGYRLRTLKLEDAGRMLEWMHDESVIKGLNTQKFRCTQIDDCIRFIEKSHQDRESRHFAVADENDIYMGTVSLKHIDTSFSNAEFSIALHSDSQGKGVGRFAMAQIMEYAFEELKLDEVYWNVLKDNIHAMHLYDSLGYERTDFNPDGPNVDLQYRYRCSKDLFYNICRFT